MVGDDGFEPTQHNATDLQSAPTLQLRRSPQMVLSEPSIDTTDLEITKNSTWWTPWGSNP